MIIARHGYKEGEKELHISTKKYRGGVGLLRTEISKLQPMGQNQHTTRSCKILLDHSPAACLHIACGCLCATTTELSHDRARLACEA